MLVSQILTGSHNDSDIAFQEYVAVPVDANPPKIAMAGDRIELTFASVAGVKGDPTGA